ncbi:hypothetical protein ACFLYE_01580, partial [Chloroflexota bacterium]
LFIFLVHAYLTGVKTSGPFFVYPVAPVWAIRGNITIGTNATVLIGKEVAGKIKKILAAIIPSKINSLKPAETIRRIPAIIGIEVCRLSIFFLLNQN